MSNWHEILIDQHTSILKAIQIIDQTGLRAALVVDKQYQLLGIVTDGDVRRALLKKIELSEPVLRIMNQCPVTASIDETREQILAKMHALSICHIPIVDAEYRLVGFETLDDLLSIKRIDNPVIVMAGGLGERLYPLTTECPKPLLKIGNKPILRILLENFIKSGFHNFHFSVNYKSEMIKDYFGCGKQWGVSIKYIEETKKLGTAGALSLMDDLPQKAFFVINADVLTNINYKYLLDYHNESKASATMCVKEYEQMIPYGVVERDKDSHHLVNIVEKPVKHYFVNTGIYILEPVLLNLLNKNEYCDMPELLMRCVNNYCNVATFPLHEYWLDIGRHDDLEKAHQDFDKVMEC